MPRAEVPHSIWSYGERNAETVRFQRPLQVQCMHLPYAVCLAERILISASCTARPSRATTHDRVVLGFSFKQNRRRQGSVVSDDRVADRISLPRFVFVSNGQNCPVGVSVVWSLAKRPGPVRRTTRADSALARVQEQSERPRRRHSRLLAKPLRTLCTQAPDTACARCARCAPLARAS